MLGGNPWPGESWTGGLGKDSLGNGIWGRRGIVCWITQTIEGLVVKNQTFL